MKKGITITFFVPLFTGVGRTQKIYYFTRQGLHKTYLEEEPTARALSDRGITELPKAVRLGT